MAHSSLKTPHKQKTAKKRNSVLGILVFIMIVNALSYGTIIPLLYPFSARFGLGPVGLGLLFTSFSIAQFFATPIMGRLSDKYGRKPMLLLSLIGSALSLAMMAVAQNVFQLFVARIIDGVTGGNISIAQAVISDSVEGEERAKSFGMIGAAFGIGFLVGPAIGGALSWYALTAPFWFAAFLALLAVIGIQVLLPETLSAKNKKADQGEPLFKFTSIFRALFIPVTGIILLINFLATLSLNTQIMGFQTVTNDMFKLSTFQIGLFFSTFGLISIIMQVFGIGAVLKRFHKKESILFWSLVLSAIAIFAEFFFLMPIPFFFLMMTFAIVGAFQNPMLTALITERTSSEDQGEILGIHQSYTSLGQILGPIIAGVVIKEMSLPFVFVAAGIILVLAVVATHWLHVTKKKVDL